LGKSKETRRGRRVYSVDELLKSAKPVSGKTPWNPPEVRKSEIIIEMIKGIF
jgi:hypothetical protein